MINLVPIYGFFLRNKTADTVKIKIYRPAVPPPGGPDYSAPAPGEDYDPAPAMPRPTQREQAEDLHPRREVLYRLTFLLQEAADALLLPRLLARQWQKR